MGIVLFFFTVIISFFTQLPFLIESGISNVLKLVWLLPFTYYIVTSSKLFFSKTLTFFYVFVFLFISYCFILQCIKDVRYIDADVFNIAISLMVTVVSYCFWMRSGTTLVLKRLSAICLLICVILASVVYVFFLMNSSLAAVTYAFAAKNSMGQILLNGAILGLTCFLPKGNIQKFFLIFCLIWITVVVFMLKSRATILGIIFIILYFIFKSDNKNIRKVVLFGTILFTCILFISEDVYDVIVNKIALGNREATDLNSISSGRGDLMEIQVQKIPDSPIFGSGASYMDCFPLMMVVQFGLIGASIVFTFLYKVAKIIDKRFIPRKNIYLAVYLIFWAGMLNSLFEAQPPFGPGIKMFLLWVCFGFSLAKYNKSKNGKKDLKNVGISLLHS